MKEKHKKRLILGYAFLLAFAVAPTVQGMHIMEGFLPVKWCIAWGIFCIPSIFLGFAKIRRILNEKEEKIMMLAMAAAFTFVLSALKIPSVTGSSSHMTGLGFAAILFGPQVSAVLGFIVLIFQALLLAHGGLTTLGANTFSMGIVGPLVAYGIYRLGKKNQINRSLVIFLAACFGDLATYVITSLQLAMAFPQEVGGLAASFLKFASIFALTQIPLAIMEGLLTVVLMNVVTGYGISLDFLSSKEPKAKEVVGLEK